MRTREEINLALFETWYREARRQKPSMPEFTYTDEEKQIIGAAIYVAMEEYIRTSAEVIQTAPWSPEPASSGRPCYETPYNGY